MQPARDRYASAGFEYPPPEPGIPALSVAEVLEPHRDLIDRIKICYGVDRPTFERELLSLIRRYAGFVHLLPATADNYFNAPGGLLRFGLEVAFFSLQGTDAHIFSGRSTISARRQLEPRWRHATFIAGLCSEIYRTLNHVIVTNESGDEWQPFLLPLSTWLNGQGASRYFLKWIPNAHESRALGVFAFPHVVPADALQHLADGNSIVVPHLMASICGMSLYREHNILDDLVRRSVALVVDRHLQENADRYGKTQLGSHVERYLVDALRRLISSHSAWKPNGEKSRVWFGSDGLFIVWPNAAIEIRHALEADHLLGIPKEAGTILDILAAAGVFESQDSARNTWEIVPPGSSSAIEAVKVSSPAVLFGGIDPAPQALAVPLMRPGGASSLFSEAKPDAPADDPRRESSDRKPGQQLQLPISRGEPAEQGDALPLGPQFKLQAPMRLNPAVRDALAQIISTMNRDGADVAACTISSGVFIPLTEFERRKIEPSLALRALADVKMLAQPSGAASQTITRDFRDERKVGLVLSAHFVDGLDARNFSAADV